MAAQSSVSCLILLSLSIAISVISGDAVLGDESDKRPNILFICTDDQAPWALGASGNKQAVTPHMDRLVSQGAYLVNSFVTTPVCSPSRAATLTGRYGYESGVRNWVQFGKRANGQGIDPASVTTAELLKQAGYSTSLIGKWHLGEEKEHHPNNHGFDYFMGHIQGGFAVNNPVFQRNRKPVRFRGLTADVLADDVIARLSHHASDETKTPFFIAWHTRAPHARWLPVAPEDMAPYDVPNFRADVPDYPDLDRARVDRMMKEYLASTRGVDRNLGRVMAELDKSGLAENTIVIYTSDHGYNMGHHGIWHKGNGHWVLNHPVPRKGNIGENQRPNMWENSIRVPSIVRWPGRIEPNCRIDADTTNLDWFPTILAMAGVEQPQNPVIRGENLVPLLTGEKDDTERDGVFSFLSFYGEYARIFIGELRMWRTDRWKLVRDFRNPHLDELYDLKNDPTETTNEINNPEYKAIIAELDSKILNEMRDSNDPALQYLPAQKETGFFNGKDLTGWKGNDGYWTVKDGAIVGHSDKNVSKNEFIWSDTTVADFYLSVDVKLTPDTRNAGIQFRSKPINEHGQAVGYQADVGSGVWGKLYHEHGRGKLDWNNNAAGAVKPGEWNRYEILAKGHRIWTAINGKLCVAIEDPDGELSGKIAFQIHSGPPQTVQYRSPTLTHNPKLELAGMNEQQLVAALPKKQATLPATSQSTPPPPSLQVTEWRKKLDAADPGMAGKWAAAAFDDSKWQTMNVPGHYERKGLRDFDGTVWFRRTVDIAEADAGKDLTLALGPIDDMDMTFFNGQQVGGIQQPGHWATNRTYKVPGRLVKAGRNVIAVRVIDHGWSGGFAGKPAQMKLTGNGTSITLGGEWRYSKGVELKTIGLGPLPNPTTTTKPSNNEPALPEVSALLRPLARPDKPVSAFTDGFKIDSDQTIAILGGTNALESGRHGYLETLLVTAHPQHKVRLRNLAWQADTVYQQQRPRNFYSANKPSYGERDGRSRIKADIVFFWMGQTESLDGPQRIDEFTAAYNQHLDQISAYTKRIVPVTPVPFSNPLKLEIDMQKRVDSLRVYVAAIRQIARERNLPVVDLAEAFGWGSTPVAYSRNGLHLLPSGHWDAATAFAKQLRFADRVASIRWFDEGDDHPAGLEPASAETLRTAIRQKNDLWFRYWRPTNWAFLYGNRQTQPSSREHTNPSRRWFPEEVKSALNHIELAEQRIATLAGQEK